MTAELQRLIAELEAQIADPRQGLPEEVFLFISRLTPMVNVDLLIKNSRNETLLTWREDRFYGPAWHIPGGIIRFKETAAQRIREVAEAELGTTVEFVDTPLAVTEMTAPNRNTRGHFISLLYECRLDGSPTPELAWRMGTPTHGEWAWHASCPENLIPPQRAYENFIESSVLPSRTGK